MTDRKQALTDLLEDVEGGSDNIYRASTFVKAFKPLLGYDAAINAAGWARRSYNGSLDAAKALHETILPDGAQWSYYSDDGHCIVSYGRGTHDYAEAHDPDNPARAWLIAILKALIAKEDA